MTIRIPRAVLLAVLTVACLFGAVAAAYASEPNWFKGLEDTSNQIATTQIKNDPYPVNQMQNSLERANLVKRLLAFNNPKKIGYLYITSFGKFVGYYTIEGKISSTQSELTNTQQHWNNGSGDTVIESIGDDGTFGPEEGGDAGTFFFTTSGVMVETDLDWIYSDKPLHIDVPNLETAKTG